MSIDIAAYLDRIGYGGSTSPTLGLLRSLHARHPATIPFESVDPFLGRGVSIDPDVIQNKLVRCRRGGYCHEHNALFHDVLAVLGFSVGALGGRVVWMTPGRDAPLTHRMTLVVLPEGRYIADVGFGAQTPPEPLKLEPELEQVTSHGAYRIVARDDVYEVQLKVHERWEAMYRFRLDPMSRADFEMANWYTSTYPSGRFTRNLVVARMLETSTASLINRTLTTRGPDGPREQRNLTDPADLEDVLNHMMALEVPVAPEVLWNRLPDPLIALPS